MGFCNWALISREKLKQWSISYLVSIPKSGNLSKGENYGEIAPSSVVFKTYNHAVLNRIKSIMKVYQRRNQNEFRGEKSTMSQILVFQRVIRGVKEKNYLMVITFIDSKEVFHSI